MKAENNKRMNILWIVDHLGYNNAMHGAGMYYLNTIPVFDKKKFNVILCVLREEDYLIKFFTDKEVNLRILGRGKFSPMTLVDILRITKEEHIQLIHAHGYGAANFGRLAGMIRGIPTIVHAHDDDRYYPLYQNLADRLLRNHTDKAIAVSGSVGKSCVNKRHIGKDKTFVIHNGIPLKDFAAPDGERVRKERARLGIGPDFKVIGTVAKLREEKGTRYLIESAVKVLEIFPKTLLLIAGDGPLMEELKTLSEKLGIADRVIFAGFRDDIPVILSIIDIFIVPSITEGSPLALLEAMAMGKPIVATNVGGIVEILRDGETGLLVPSRDPGAIAEKVVQLFRNEAESGKLGLSAKEEAEKYDIQSHGQKLAGHYDELIASAQ
jgi:glycosyltransferase involved in cell wall biosynthesis